MERLRLAFLLVLASSFCIELVWHTSQSTKTMASEPASNSSEDLFRNTWVNIFFINWIEQTGITFIVSDRFLGRTANETHPRRTKYSLWLMKYMSSMFPLLNLSVIPVFLFLRLSVPNLFHQFHFESHILTILFAIVTIQPPITAVITITYVFSFFYICSFLANAILLGELSVSLGPSKFKKLLLKINYTKLVLPTLLRLVTDRRGSRPKMNTVYLYQKYQILHNLVFGSSYSSCSRVFEEMGAFCVAFLIAGLYSVIKLGSEPNSMCSRYVISVVIVLWCLNELAEICSCIETSSQALIDGFHLWNPKLNQYERRVIKNCRLLQFKFPYIITLNRRNLAQSFFELVIQHIITWLLW